MPTSINKTRLRKAFNEGRRAANEANAENPYDNPKLRELWEAGRVKQRSGELKTPLPPLARGESRAFRPTPGRPEKKLRREGPPPPRTGGRFSDRRRPPRNRP